MLKDNSIVDKNFIDDSYNCTDLKKRYRKLLCIQIVAIEAKSLEAGSWKLEGDIEKIFAGLGDSTLNSVLLFEIQNIFFHRLNALKFNVNYAEINVIGRNVLRKEILWSKGL